MISNIRKIKLKSEINIVPMLDILLVLLLIFVVTSPILTQSLEVDLPDSTNTKAITTDNLMVILEVIGIDNYNILVNDVRIESVQQNKIISIIKEQIEKNSKIFFFIGGDKEVHYNEIIKMLNILHNLGIKSVGLLTNPILD
ncbi:colicin uptake protein TolR [Candidatus Providencia siddallii]|uniref:Tol-Pal system protein TolR n=1 Tax=Candidatus Providencia siddallii TaxID=1715285 RepID=A0ABM9NNF8_9GAMM